MQSVTARWLVFISRPSEGRRLSWPGGLGEILRWFARPKTVILPSICCGDRPVANTTPRPYHWTTEPPPCRLYTVNEMLQTWICRCWCRCWHRCSWVVNATSTKTRCVVSTGSPVESSLFRWCIAQLQLIYPTFHSFADSSVTWPILQPITSQYCALVLHVW